MVNCSASIITREAYTVPPKIYVINLVAAQDRQAFMRQQLQPLDVPFEFFDAIHGTQNPDHYLFKKYNNTKRTRLRGANSSLKLSQLGCFASHYLLWEKCVQGSEPIIVLEDDAILLPTFIQFIEDADKFANHYDLVWMQPSRKVANQTGHPLERIGAFTVKKFAKGFAGATGYLVTPNAAQALLDYSVEWLYPVDNTMDRFYDHKIEAIGLDPACLTQDDNFQSFINEPDFVHKRTLQDTIRHEYANLKDNLRRVSHNVAFLIGRKITGILARLWCPQLCASSGRHHTTMPTSDAEHKDTAQALHLLSEPADSAGPLPLRNTDKVIQ
nr:glycosyltransferase family 25 protein [Eoetvoesiella caeni]